jgi:hypothetical protein
LAALIQEAISGADATRDPAAASFVMAAANLALYSVESPHESIRQSRSVGEEDDSTALLRTILRITALWQVGRMRDVDIEIDGFRVFAQALAEAQRSWYIGHASVKHGADVGQFDSARELGEQFLRELGPGWTIGTLFTVSHFSARLACN